MSLRLQARWLAALFGVFIVGVATLRDWIHSPDPPSAPSATPSVEASPARAPAAAAPGPVVAGAQLVAVNGAYVAEDPDRALEPGMKWIELDVELNVAEGSDFTPGEVALLVSGRVESREPSLHWLDATGAERLADAVASRGAGRRRMRLGYAVPREATEVELAYGTASLTRSAIALERER